jgi:hypothetical protein
MSTYAAESGYEFFGDMEIRILQGPDVDPPQPAIQSQRSIFSKGTLQLKATYSASFRLPDGDSYSCSLPDLPDLAEEETDPRSYGTRLFDWLFDSQMKEKYQKIRRSAEFFSGDSPANFNGLRLRLLLDPYSIKLHGIWWEAMFDPESRLPLSCTMAFSRFMRVLGPESAITEGPLRFLLIASNPHGLSRFNLEEVNVSLEKSIVTHATNKLRDKLEIERLMPNVTLDDLSQLQTKGRFHIIHLLAHSVSSEEQGFMILADEKGEAKEVPCSTVVSALVSSGAAPYLIFLATPLTAGRLGPALVSMSPSLVGAGARAALAIQGPINEERLSRFSNCFYETLIKTGTIDLALMSARNEIYDPSDWEWANPVLYMRIPDGQLFRPLPESLRNIVFNASNL